MPKISVTKTRGLFASYFFKMLLSSVLSVLILNMIVSFLFYKLDIDLMYLRYASVAVCLFCSIIISSISIIGFKNNFIMLSLISQIPLIILVFINFLKSDYQFTVFIIKIILIIVGAILVAFIKSLKKW